VSGVKESTPAVERRIHTTRLHKLAFSLYESRGQQDGHQIDDWLHAEQELVWHYA
jgi:hypothetical protein